MRVEAGQYTPRKRSVADGTTTTTTTTTTTATATATPNPSTVSGPLAPAHPAPERLAGVEAAEAACRAPLARLAQDLRLSLQYYRQTFGGEPVERLDFIGGGTAGRRWCAQIAAGLGLRAVIGDPLGLARAGDPVTAANPAAWCVAAGLSLSGERAAVPMAA
jgi:hypothetical protein